MTASEALSAVLDRVDRDLNSSLDRLFALLRIQSVSTDPAYAAQCRTAAEHVAADLRGLGFQTSVRPTDGHPVVVGKSGNGEAGSKANGKPRVLFYGHYDVQPVDPLDLWQTPPFEPRIETLDGGRKIIIARGACDDKGQAMTFVEACRAFKAVTGELPLDITMLIEGEEECGSKHLFGFVRDNAAELRRDLALVCDTGMWDAQTPSITTSLRGLVYEEVRLTCADRDLHSGLFGGAARNPIHVLVDVLSAMHKPDGSVAIPGFYDGVHELPPDIKADLAGLQLTPEKFLGPIGLKIPGRRAGPHADRADFHAADRRGERHHRRLYRGGGKDRHSRQGHGEGLVPPGRRPGPGKDPRRTSANSSARGCRGIARSSSATSPARRPSMWRSTIRRSARRAPRLPRNGAKRQ